MPTEATDARKTIKISQDELPACCPPKEEETWNQHPRVYIDLKQNGRGACPYCGNQFELSD